MTQVNRVDSSEQCDERFSVTNQVAEARENIVPLVEHTLSEEGIPLVLPTAWEVLKCHAPLPQTLSPEVTRVDGPLPAALEPLPYPELPHVSINQADMTHREA